MQDIPDQKSNRRLPIGLIAGLSALMVTGGSAAAFFAWQSSVRESREAPWNVAASQDSEGNEQPPSVAPSGKALPPSSAPIQPSQKTEPKPAPATVEQTAQIFYFKDVGSELELTAIPFKLKSGDTTEAILQGAIETLLADVPDSTLTSVIPSGTQLLSLKVKPDGIHVNLSKSFTTGGGSASMMGRVAQILYTATSSNPNSPVFLSVEGKLLETLGGEGLMLDQPMTRQKFETDQREEK
ncbi:MAG: spore germination protein [Leptolyngbyaceae cyanobacterium CSU_1_3]|nr:spore germination protein [Leptolyngbyaceae cyanobacterium CSU_1_3]